MMQKLIPSQIAALIFCALAALPASGSGKASDESSRPLVIASMDYVKPSDKGTVIEKTAESLRKHFPGRSVEVAPVPASEFGKELTAGKLDFFITSAGQSYRLQQDHGVRVFGTLVQPGYPDLRFGLSAIKSLGRPTIAAIIKERKNAPFTTMQDFITRMFSELNKRTIENLIKSGAFDTFGNNRRQMMFVYAQLLDNAVKQSKDAISGQMSLFDFVSEEEKTAYEVQMPDVAEYYKEELLAFEKEILGVYVSGHPLDEYAAMWKRHISAMTTDFELDEETGELKAKDNTRVTIGGMIMDKTVKTTKNGQLMAFLTIEDLVGTVEVLVFPQSFNTYRSVIDTSDKVFVTGRVSANADENGKLICEKIVSFDSVPQKLWIRFANMAEYQEKQEELTKILAPSDGHDSVIIYCAEEKLKKQLPPSMNVKVEAGLVAQLREVFGTKNVETT